MAFPGTLEKPLFLLRLATHITLHFVIRGTLLEIKTQTSKLKMPKKMNTFDFREKAIRVHQGKYDYSKSLYTSASSRLTVTCLSHGDFTVVASQHLSGNGCRNCWLERAGKTSKLTRDEFIQKSIAMHGPAYDYSLVKYEKNTLAVDIICSNHGLFKQKPVNHLAGRGCQECGKAKKSMSLNKGIDFFIRKSLDVHGDRYDYSRSVYVLAKTKIEIICTEHGPFWMTPNAHTNGQGCAKCADALNANKRLKPFSEFLLQANAAHSDKYQYIESTYSGDSRKLEIVCGNHGSFWQSPNSHLKGRGCPKCSVPGFDVEKPAHLYLLKSDCGAYIKVGIANKLRDRQTKLRKRTPFKFEVIHTFESGGHEIASLEKHYHGKLESCGFRYFDGATEWFKLDRDVVAEIQSL